MIRKNNLWIVAFMVFGVKIINANTSKKADKKSLNVQASYDVKVQASEEETQKRAMEKASVQISSNNVKADNDIKVQASEEETQKRAMEKASVQISSNNVKADNDIKVQASEEENQKRAMEKASVQISSNNVKVNNDVKVQASEEENQKRAMEKASVQISSDKEKQEKWTIAFNDNKSETITSLAQSGKTGLKIRFVESFDTMRQCEQGIECGKSLEKTREQLSRAIQEDEQKITQAMTEFQSKASTLNDTARVETEKKLRKMKTEYDTRVQESEYEMKLTMQKTTEGLALDMEKAVVMVAEQEKLDAVVDTVTGRALYVKPELNITQSVVKQMNNTHQQKLAQNKATAKAETVMAANMTPKAPVKIAAAAA